MRKQQTPHAAAAAEIRQELKRRYPETRFQVRSERYSGGSSINITWSGGPSEDEVKPIAKHYQAGSFNPMDDSYTFDSAKRNHPTATFVFTHRTKEEATQ